MSFMARREASQLNNTHPGVVTTTVFTYPTITSAAPQTSRGTIPVAAIVGGVIAGMLLAIILTAGWVCWGKSIKRTEAKQRSEAEAFHKTKYNTLHNAAASKPRIQAYQPLFSRPAGKKIRFAGDDDGEVGDGNVGDGNVDDRGPEIPLPSLVNQEEVATFSAPSAVVPKGSKPKLLRSVKGSQRLSSLTATSKDRLSIASLRDSASFGPGISHKPSTISSASVYSTASGEEHAAWALRDSIVAALNLESLRSNVDAASRNSSGGTNWHSPVSLRQNYFSALDQGGPPSNRHSQASNGSTGLPRIDENGAPIGMAY